MLEQAGFLLRNQSTFLFTRAESYGSIVITVITASVGISLFSDWKRHGEPCSRVSYSRSFPDFLPVVFSSSYPPIASKHPPAYGSAISFVESMSYRTSTCACLKLTHHSPMICDQLLNSLLMYACISSLLLGEYVLEGQK